MVRWVGGSLRGCSYLSGIPILGFPTPKAGIQLINDAPANVEHTIEHVSITDTFGDALSVINSGSVNADIMLDHLAVNVVKNIFGFGGESAHGIHLHANQDTVANWVVTDSSVNSTQNGDGLRPDFDLIELATGFPVIDLDIDHYTFTDSFDIGQDGGQTGLEPLAAGRGTIDLTLKMRNSSSASCHPDQDPPPPVWR